jgi:hypothetical protein
MSTPRCSEPDQSGDQSRALHRAVFFGVGLEDSSEGFVATDGLIGGGAQSSYPRILRPYMDARLSVPNVSASMRRNVE